MNDHSAASRDSSLYFLNSLFSEWITEWKDEAANRELKSQYTYAKALRSLKKYPLPLESAKECKMLDGFGSKICQMLDARLVKYNSRQGELMKDTAGSISSNSSRINSTKAPSSFYSVDSGNETDGATVVMSHKSKSVGAVKQKQKSRKAVGYIPRKDSGSYALIMALYKHHRTSTGNGYMLKRQLIDAAQPLCEHSFTTPDVGSHYTAWSSMGTLINKGFVSKSNCPARYSITESGCDLACKLQLVDEHSTADKSLENSQLENYFKLSDAEKTDSANDKEFCSKYPKSDFSEWIVGSSDCREVGSQLATVGDERVESRQKEIVTGQLSIDVKDVPARFTNADNGSIPSSLSQNSLSFVYVDPEGNEVLMKDHAAVIIDEEVTIGFLAKVNYQDLLLSGKRYKLDADRECAGGYVYAYLHNEDAPEIASLRTCVKTSSELATSCLTSNNEKLMMKTEDNLNSAVSCVVTESLAAEKNYVLSKKKKVPTATLR